MIINVVFLFTRTPGMSIFLARHLTDPDKAMVTGADFLYVVDINQSKNCTITIKPELYGNFLLLSINILFTQFLLMWIIDRIGRKIPICKYNHDQSLRSLNRFRFRRNLIVVKSLKPETY